MKFETKRLKDLGFKVEALCVRCISKSKVNAGYDIESYDGKAKGMNHDRFIEVKGSRGPNLRFIWSPNEVEVAKRLGSKYWIYFQGGVDKKKNRANNKPILFQDPYKNIFVEGKIPITPHGYIVQANARGEIIVR